MWGSRKGAVPGRRIPKVQGLPRRQAASERRPLQLLTQRAAGSRLKVGGLHEAPELVPLSLLPSKAARHVLQRQRGRADLRAFLVRDTLAVRAERELSWRQKVARR